MHFAGKRAPTGDQLRFRVSGGCAVIWRLLKRRLQRWQAMDRYWPPAGCRGVNGSDCLHTVVGVSLLANALDQPMHQGLAKCISRASALLQAINCASEFQPGARSSGVLDRRLQQWQTWIVIGRLRGWRG
jgi:hypothetical protein